MNDTTRRPLPSDYKGPSEFDWQALTPEDSPMTPVDLLDDAKHVDLSTATLAVGDLAHGFVRPIFDFAGGTAVATGTQLDLLATAAKRPVALVFGSYT